MRKEDISYPDYVVVISDGEGEAAYTRSFQHPERWMFILSPRPMSWSRKEKAYVLSKDQDDVESALRLCSFLYMDQHRHCPFWETRNGRPKHLPLAVNYKEFMNPGRYSYELHDETNA
jgi:hypothetical protein